MNTYIAPYIVRKDTVTNIDINYSLVVAFADDKLDAVGKMIDTLSKQYENTDLAWKINYDKMIMIPGLVYIKMV